MANPEANLFDLTLERFKRHIDTEQYHQVAFALWALHTHVYQKFEYTPRLSLQSPTQESGKSEVLKILRFISPNAKSIFTPTIATLFRLAGRNTVLIDEVDNVPIRGDLLSILNKGHEKGGAVPRVYKNEVVEWPVFGPIAFGGIGTLPSTLGSRSIVVPMYRYNPDAKITRFDITNMEQVNDLAFVGELASEWAQGVNLNKDPIMPDGFHGRKGNKWRVLFAIADSLNRGDIARKAASMFPNTDAHPAELMLTDIRKVFDRLELSLVINEALVKEMLGLEDAVYDWSNYKGQKLTVGLLAQALKGFGIAPRQKWLPEDKPRLLQRKHRIYSRADFEEMWIRYRVPPQPSGTSGTSGTRKDPIIKLVKPESKKKPRFKVTKA